MIADITALLDKLVYTEKGKFVGKVRDVQLDFTDRRISGLWLENYDKELFEPFGVDTKGVVIPYRIVLNASEDIILIRMPTVQSVQKTELDDTQ
jgi:sporulation protein YlmC with PRC-barrel domain